jgi:hypothetical protein
VSHTSPQSWLVLHRLILSWVCVCVLSSSCLSQSSRSRSTWRSFDRATLNLRLVTSLVAYMPTLSGAALSTQVRASDDMRVARVVCVCLCVYACVCLCVMLQCHAVVCRVYVCLCLVLWLPVSAVVMDGADIVAATALVANADCCRAPCRRRR